MNDEMVERLAMTTRIACTAITTPRLTNLQASVNQASDIPAGFPWDRKAAAHAEIFGVLADATGDPWAARTLSLGAGLAYDLMMAVGRVADGMAANSRKRMLAHLRAGDADAAALEMEKHLRVLSFMCRLAQLPARRASA
jgi:DNA-binding GntR family transcriptional regulator